MDRPSKSWVSPPVLAMLVGCDRRTILSMIQAGSLKADRVGRCWRIQLVDAVAAFPHALAAYRATG